MKSVDIDIIQKGKIVHLIEILPIYPYDTDAIFIALTAKVFYGADKERI